jgi:radical SAM superfamily enzyme YgiQ (UPF0313 family)
MADDVKPTNNNVLLIGPCKPSSGIANWGAPHLGLHRLAAWLRKHSNVKVTVHDPCIDGLASDELISHADLIGFSVTNETLAVDISEIIRVQKINRKATLVIGGVEATLNYQEVLDRTHITWVVLGNGEHSLLSILNGESPDKIPGTIYRNYNNQPSNDDLWQQFQCMNFGDMGYERYWAYTESMYDSPNVQDIRTVRLVTSTHCNRGCAFCSVTQWQKAAAGKLCKPGYLNAHRLLELVAKVKCEVPTTETIYFCEDDFCLDRQRVDEFCAKSGELDLTYLVQTHTSRVDDNLIETLAAGGVRHLTMGVENASDSVLADLNKKQDLSKIPNIISQCIDAGITPYLLIMLFPPSSRMDDLKKNCEVLSDWMRQGAIVSVEPYVMPYRGAPLWDSMYEREHVIDSVDGRAMRRETRFIPDDPAVANLMRKFELRWPDYQRERATSHAFKGVTGRLAIELLSELLAEVDNALAA